MIDKQIWLRLLVGRSPTHLPHKTEKKNHGYHELRQTFGALPKERAHTRMSQA